MQVIYREESAYNGTVEVTAHEGTAIHCSERQVEWRVLRFNGVTRQSASRVVSSSQQDNSWVVDPACLAQEYLKSMASVYAALRPSSHQQQEGRRGSIGERLLCLGVGGGSLPQFLAHHFPDSEVDAVEIDPVVIHAAHQAMGLGEDHSSGRLRFHVQDALQFAKGCAESGTPEYDAIFMDVFDGEDNTPRTLLEQEFASYLNDILHPRHGSLIMNVHGIPPSRPAEVFRAAMMARDAATSTSMIFSVGCKKQRMNITLVCTRGHGLPADSKATPAALKSRAAHVASAAGFAFPAGTRACYNYSRLA
jgi:spermidine synthase